MKNLQFDTKAIREGYQTTNEQEHSEAIFLTSSFKFDSAEQAANRFSPWTLCKVFFYPW
jgi:O-succinylhomoserine sulfhydrylase